MYEKEIIDKVIEWFKKENINYSFKKQGNYKISFPQLGLNKPLFRVDLIVNDENTNRKIGVECKSVNDSNTFRKLCAGFGQAYVLQRMFGISYLAIEVNRNIHPDENIFEFYKRESLLTNWSREVGIGILLVSNNVIQVEKAKYVKPVANTLFISMGV